MSSVLPDYDKDRNLGSVLAVGRGGEDVEHTGIAACRSGAGPGCCAAADAAGNPGLGSTSEGMCVLVRGELHLWSELLQRGCETHRETAERRQWQRRPQLAAIRVLRPGRLGTDRKSGRRPALPHRERPTRQRPPRCRRFARPPSSATRSWQLRARRFAPRSSLLPPRLVTDVRQSGWRSLTPRDRS